MTRTELLAICSSALLLGCATGGVPEDAAQAADASATVVERSEDAPTAQEAQTASAVPLIIYAPRKQRPGETPVLSITLDAPPRYTVDVLNEGGDLIGSIARFGARGMSSESISLPGVPVTGDSMKVYLALRKPGEAAVQDSSGLKIAKAELAFTPAE